MSAYAAQLSLSYADLLTPDCRIQMDVDSRKNEEKNESKKRDIQIEVSGGGACQGSQGRAYGLFPGNPEQVASHSI